MVPLPVLNLFSDTVPPSMVRVLSDASRQESAITMLPPSATVVVALPVTSL